MAFFLKILPWIQITLSVLLMAAVLLQQSAAGIGGAIGGSDVSATFHTRRGFERFLFISTFILAFLFVLAALAAIFF
jgi:protein translocase SecG subunit